MSGCNFNYKYLKDNSTPGSWRRGYEYHQKEQVASFEVGKTGVKAKVKGNFKSFYDVELKFKKNEVEPSCSCPLKEKWCKHAIAVAMKTIDEHIYDEFAQRRYKIEPDYSDTETEMNPNPKGGYIFHFNPKRRQNFFSILVMDRNTNKVIRDIEAIFKAIIAAQKADSNFELNNSQKIEFAIFQQLLKNSRLDKKAGWYDVPIAKFDGFFQLLALADDVIDGKSKHKLVFCDDEWKLS
ncbi:SWIM zinc finger family protein, partial [bacterium]|nr:SWIM zinc finger family protein [bacterium]